MVTVQNKLIYYKNERTETFRDLPIKRQADPFRFARGVLLIIRKTVCYVRSPNMEWLNWYKIATRRAVTRAKSVKS